MHTIQRETSITVRNAVITPTRFTINKPIQGPLPLTSAHNNSRCSTPQSIVHTRPHPGLLREGTPGWGWVDRSGTRTRSSVAHHPSQRRRAFTGKDELVTIASDACTWFTDIMPVRYKIHLITVWEGKKSWGVPRYMYVQEQYVRVNLLNNPVVKEPRTVITGLSPSMAVTR